MERYRHLNKDLKNRFGKRTLKICVDGDFTCPNRDGTKGKGGCIFCSERGSGDHLKTINITSQITSHLNSYRGERAESFILYFQNFTNTYDTIENLKLKYDAVYSDSRIVGLQVATRPDCINEEIVKLLSTYSKDNYVCIELGLQTSNDNTGILLNRCYTTQDFTNAVALLNKYNIDVVGHIMIGLPGENFEDVKETVKYINTQNIQGLKVHSTYVTDNTVLANMYKEGKYSPISLEDYLTSLEYVITHINPKIVLHRISGDAPKDSLLAPEWNTHKKLVLNGIDKIMLEKDLYQGMYFSN